MAALAWGFCGRLFQNYGSRFCNEIGLTHHTLKSTQEDSCSKITRLNKYVKITILKSHAVEFLFNNLCEFKWCILFPGCLYMAHGHDGAYFIMCYIIRKLENSRKNLENCFCFVTDLT